MDILAIIQCICSVLSLFISIYALTKVNSINKTNSGSGSGDKNTNTHINSINSANINIENNTM